MKMGFDYSTVGQYKNNDLMPERIQYQFKSKEDLDNFEKFAEAILSVMTSNTVKEKGSEGKK